MLKKVLVLTITGSALGFLVGIGVAAVFGIFWGALLPVALASAIPGAGVFFAHKEIFKTK